MQIPYHIMERRNEELFKWRKRYHTIPDPAKDLWGTLNKVWSFQEDITQTIESITKKNNSILACAEKCSYCCYVPVRLNAAEIFLIVKRFAKLPDLVKTNILERLPQIANSILQMGAAKHEASSVPCVFLIQDSCAIYDFRPSVCRKMHSMSKSLCKQFFEDQSPIIEPTPDVEAFMVSNMMVFAFFQKVQESGLDHREYEMSTALNCAFKTEKHLQDWCRKRVAFPELDSAGTP